MAVGSVVLPWRLERFSRFRPRDLGADRVHGYIVMYPCLRKVKCGYSGCGSELIQKNLKKHTLIRHNSSKTKPVPLNNNTLTFGAGGSWNVPSTSRKGESKVNA